MANIKDVARLANVSVATVSRVINNKGYVNEHTKELVEDAVKELNYIPNEIARSLYRKSSKIIGIIIPDLKNEFFNEMITGMEDIIFQNEYKTMLCTTKESPDREKEYLQMFSTNKIDGLIICTNLSNIEYLKQLNIPAVTLERTMSPTIPSIIPDNVMGGALAAKELIKRDCRHLVQFRGPSNVPSANERSKGFLQTLEPHPEIKVHSVELEFNEDSSIKIFNFLENHPEIDGIFTASDYIAAKSLRCLKKLKRQAPEDVQIIGYDNVSIGTVTNPTISTIAQPIQEMGELAATMLFRLLEKEEIEDIHLKLPVKFIERESTKK